MLCIQRRIRMLIIFIFILVVIYWYGIRNHGYWRRKNVEYEKPLPFFGNDAQSFLQRKTRLQTACEIYWRHPKKPYVGIYRGNVPLLIVRDPDLIKDILVTNFNCFESRGINPCEDTVEPLFQNLFSVDEKLWRPLRQHLTPAFTVRRLKTMFSLITEIAENLQARVDLACNHEIDAYDLFGRYATDFIGSCGFGVDARSLDDDDSIFRKLSVKISKTTISRTVTITLKCIFPYLFKSLKFLGQKLEDDITRLVNLRSNERNNRPSTRGDFVDFMLDLSLKEKRCSEKVSKDSGTVLELNDQLIAAQCYIFFAAGLETSTTAMTVTLHQLAKNPSKQHKVQSEINEVLKRHNGKLSYDAVNEMSFLEWSLMEGMRIHPPGLVLRKCTRPYTIPNTNITLERGIKVLIPTEAIHKDPLYFDCPEEFRPERFSPKNAAARHKFVYLPFGKGPKYCIGARLGVMQSVAGLAAILSKYDVRPSPNGKKHLKPNPSSTLVQNIDGPVPLLFYKREQKTEI